MGNLVAGNSSFPNQEDGLLDGGNRPALMWDDNFQVASSFIPPGGTTNGVPARSSLILVLLSLVMACSSLLGLYGPRVFYLNETYYLPENC